MRKKSEEKGGKSVDKRGIEVKNGETILIYFYICLMTAKKKVCKKQERIGGHNVYPCVVSSFG